MKGYVAAYRRTGVPAYRRGSVPARQRTDVAAYRRGSVPTWQRTGAAAFHTPKGYQDLAQGAGFAEPWVIS
jgi:hypothetical protein